MWLQGPLPLQAPVSPSTELPCLREVCPELPAKVPEALTENPISDLDRAPESPGKQEEGSVAGLLSPSLQAGVRGI